ncbi:hypothetical protein R3P38DRAFT_2858495 [Favolaschia claudopus]|uniref:Protein CPL1-like domain-containing protein n=1 Tax=Favolaschia claudopus TaxID=2862362 RepID=A0AAW0DLI5_9AGAR
MPRLFSLFFAAMLLSGVTASLNPCSSGALVHTENDKCECRRHNGAMGQFRLQCSATWIDGGCVGSCNAPKPKEQISLAAEAEKCPSGTQACPVGAFDSDYECVSPAEDVDNCGGCASTGEGVACGDYPGVRGAACVEGVCEVYSCFYGFTLNEGVCVRTARTKSKGATTRN